MKKQYLLMALPRPEQVHPVTNTRKVFVFTKYSYRLFWTWSLW